jgi:hypothetical protein
LSPESSSGDVPHTSQWRSLSAHAQGGGGMPREMCVFL